MPAATVPFGADWDMAQILQSRYQTLWLVFISGL
jgi:hypothetical protein